MAQTFIQKSIEQHKAMVETLELIEKGQDLKMDNETMARLYNTYHEQLKRMLFPIISKIIQNEDF